MIRKIILKVRDLEFQHTDESMAECIQATKELLDDKRYFYDGILISVNSKVAYVWKTMKPSKRKPIRA